MANERKSNRRATVVKKEPTYAIAASAAVEAVDGKRGLYGGDVEAHAVSIAEPEKVPGARERSRVARARETRLLSLSVGRVELFDHPGAIGRVVIGRCFSNS